MTDPITRERYIQNVAPGTPLHPAENTTKLFQPLTIRGVTFHNRIGVSPMCMYSSEDGHLNDYHLIHLGSFALKGAGFVCIEATSVTPEGRISPYDSGLWKDSQIEPIRRIADFVHAQGTVIGIQIGHAGRKASTARMWEPHHVVSAADGGWPDAVLAPSEVPYSETYPMPNSISVEEIHSVVDAFVATAHRAEVAGIDVIEVHAAHGYMLHEFLSGNSNKRTDQYGGSFDNRARFLMEVVEALRVAWPSKPLWVRISATDYTAPNYEPLGHDEAGWDIYQSIELSRRLYAAGVDLVDVSSGGNVPIPSSKFGVKPGYQVPFSEMIKKETGGLTASVGAIVEPKLAEEILQNGQADIILLARAFLRDSAWALNAAKELGVTVKWADQHIAGSRPLGVKRP